MTDATLSQPDLDHNGDITDMILTALHAAMKHRARMPEITVDTMFADIGMDDLEREETAMALEDALGVEITDTTMREWACAADVVACLERVMVACG